MSDIAIRPIIGMEIHVQLATRTKMFCGCPVEFAAEPNSRTCPVCLGMPGALPVINRRAVELAVRTAMALNCRVEPFTKWDRKSYFYPDLPKNYQISQYDKPIGLAGVVELPGRRPVRIRRVHLEEDAGKNLHEGPNHTRVDLNRAGTPLLEIVTEPDLASADEAFDFATQLQRLVVWLGVSEANMQKGQMRFEPNVNLSITADGGDIRTPIAEVKNLNSFRAVRDAVAFEISRQTAEWRADPDYTLDKLGKMNFGWDDQRGVTEFQRGKEEAHDYRYFPDPDLPPVRFDAAWLDAERNAVGELPWARQARFTSDYGLTPVDAETLTADRATSDLFEQAVGGGGDAATLGRLFLGAARSLANARGLFIRQLPLTARSWSELSRLAADGAVSATGMNQILETAIVNLAPPAND